MYLGTFLANLEKSTIYLKYILKMKTRFISLLLWIPLSLLVFDGCKSSSVVTIQNPTAKHLPPGQAKKMYGQQSAKAFAPGQQKKQDNTVKSQKKAKHKGKK